LAYDDEASLARRVEAILNAAVAATRASGRTEIETAARKETAETAETPANVWPRIESRDQPTLTLRGTRRTYALVVANTGPEPALHVRHRLESENDGDQIPMYVQPPVEVESLAPGGEARYGLVVTLGTAPQVRCVVRWEDSAGEHENVATLRYF